jgi:hypothetical protein
MSLAHQVFVSSSCHELRDLRASIRKWLRPSPADPSRFQAARAHSSLSDGGTLRIDAGSAIALEKSTVSGPSIR